MDLKLAISAKNAPIETAKLPIVNAIDETNHKVCLYFIVIKILIPVKE